MIDIEPRVYTTVRGALKSAFPGIDVTGRYTENPAKFPHVSIVETNNVNSSRNASTSDHEFAANVTYTVNVYTNTEAAKSDAKDIAKVVSDSFLTMGFVRTMSQPMPNINRTIYRQTLRFTALVSKAFDGIDGHYNTII